MKTTRTLRYHIQLNKAIIRRLVVCKYAHAHTHIHVFIKFYTLSLLASVTAYGASFHKNETDIKIVVNSTRDNATDIEFVVDYLWRYRYINGIDSLHKIKISSYMSLYLVLVQENYNLIEYGVLKAESFSLMKVPRCGNKYHMCYTVPSRWNKRGSPGPSFSTHTTPKKWRESLLLSGKNMRP